MSIEQTFKNWADEINKDWDGYAAIAGEENVLVYYDNNVIAGHDVARCEYKNGQLCVSGSDTYAKEDLEHFTNR